MNGKPKKKYIAILAAVVIFGILLVVGIGVAAPYGGLTKGAVSSETLYIIVALMIIFPVVLLAFIIAVMASFSRSDRRSASEIAGDETEDKNKKKDVVKSKDRVKDRRKKEGGKEETNESGNRFSTLTAIDAESRKYARDDYDESITLKQFCENFRNFAAYKSKLYYDIQDIRRFIAGLAVSHIAILQGMSGTGKTSLAYAFGEYLDNKSTVIAVQPMWKERTDLLGYYNEFTKRFNETELLQVMYKANYSKDMFVTVLDEMNIARVEYYFAEFLSKLEIPDIHDRYLDVVSDVWEKDPKLFKEGRILLPDNMWFIGTANNDDSTFAISDKVYDRAMIMNLDNKAEPFTAPKVNRVHMSAERFKALSESAMREYKMTKRNARRLNELDKYMIATFHTTFGNRIMKQIKTYIPVYVSCGGDELEALDDILSKKVLRKLEIQNPVYVKKEADGFITYLDTLFGVGNMPLCRDFMLRLCKNA